MKKICYLLLFVLTLSVSARAQTGWVTQKLDDKLSVKFPSAPEKITKNGVEGYTLKAKDSVGYIVNFLDFKQVANLDSAGLAPMKDKQEFADQLGAGLASATKNYTFGNVTIGEWKSYTTYSMTGTENTTKGTISIRMILIGSKMYSLSCRVPANLVTKNSDLFFASAEVLK
ncbi:hypothetical protein [Mucilaginibacter pedocola]|uniref:PsbP C-terminal domain-containing protein n=1 Tax=Mucilaginibacter pedocola TaxID=1792845 RepID=A0A1S9PG28_9SPHI|nr:hypothetical protein [Mucilaginibacter pedocola]OOQ59913.1 hypothetical protein BC343_27535 [Mucilaginibacter pedocola]